MVYKTFENFLFFRLIFPAYLVCLSIWRALSTLLYVHAFFFPFLSPFLSFFILSCLHQYLKSLINTPPRTGYLIFFPSFHLYFPFFILSFLPISFTSISEEIYPFSSCSGVFIFSLPFIISFFFFFVFLPFSFTSIYEEIHTPCTG